MNTMEMMAAIQYILTVAKSLHSQDYFKVSNDDTWACWCIILQKRAGIDKMDYCMFQRKYLLGCLGNLHQMLLKISRESDLKR